MRESVYWGVGMGGKGKGKEQKPVRYCNTVSAASLSIYLRENVICLCVSHTQHSMSISREIETNVVSKHMHYP